jgi:hypothetical protein
VVSPSALEVLMDFQERRVRISPDDQPRPTALRYGLRKLVRLSTALVPTERVFGTSQQGSFVRDTAEGRRRINREQSRLRRWCEREGISWATGKLLTRSTTPQTTA